MAEDKVFDVIIIGSGPAGLTAAIYTNRANLDVLILGGLQAGGQLMLTTDVENYPGFPDGIMGPDLMGKFRAQAERFGGTWLDEDVEEVDFSQRPFKVSTDEESFRGQTVIIATGANARWLDLPSEAQFRGRGVSTCATCDGAFFKDKELIVVGGGDTAMEEAIFLTRYASKVSVVHRRDELRASAIMGDRARANPKIEFIWDTVLEDYKGDGKVQSVQLKNVKTGQVYDKPIDGVFLGIGHDPNTEFLGGKIETTHEGYVAVTNHTRTTVDGVFACGDVHDTHYRQAITAAGLGCMAAIDTEKWLEAHS